MLEREKSVIGQDRGIGMPEHAKKSAFVLRINLARFAIVVLGRSDHTKTSTITGFIQTRLKLYCLPNNRLHRALERLRAKTFRKFFRDGSDQFLGIHTALGRFGAHRITTDKAGGEFLRRRASAGVRFNKRFNLLETRGLQERANQLRIVKTKRNLVKSRRVAIEKR